MTEFTPLAGAAGGAVIFGLGWGLTGFCPGPAIASMVFGQWPSVLFVVAMTVGLLAIRRFGISRATAAKSAAADG